MNPLTGYKLKQRRDVAQNPNTSQETLSILATDENYEVRWEIARNPNTPHETLSILATDGNPDVRRGVAENLNTPEEIKMLFKAYDKFGHLTK